MTKKEAQKKLTDAGIEFDPTLKLAQLHELYPQILVESEDEDEEEEDDDETENTVQDTSTPTEFKIRNSNAPLGFSVRSFDEENHGEDYEKVAAEFAEANTHKKITSDMTEDQKKEIAQFNANIKNPIVDSH